MLPYIRTIPICKLNIEKHVLLVERLYNWNYAYLFRAHRTYYSCVKQNSSHIIFCTLITTPITNYTSLHCQITFKLKFFIRGSKKITQTIYSASMYAKTKLTHAFFMCWNVCILKQWCETPQNSSHCIIKARWSERVMWLSEFFK